MISSSFEPITIIADNYRNKGNIWVRSKGTVLPAHVLPILFREKINDVWGICDGGGSVMRGKHTQVLELSCRDACEGRRLSRIPGLGSGPALESPPPSPPHQGLGPSPLLMHAHTWC